MLNKTLTILLFLLLCSGARADLSEPTSSVPASRLPSVAENIQAMDSDHDGIVTAEEISQYLQSQRGRGYRQSISDELTKLSNSRSCGSPFSRSVY